MNSRKDAQTNNNVIIRAPRPSMSKSTGYMVTDGGLRIDLCEYDPLEYQDDNGKNITDEMQFFSQIFKIAYIHRYFK